MIINFIVDDSSLNDQLPKPVLHVYKLDLEATKAVFVNELG